MLRLSQIFEHVALIFSKRHFSISQRFSLFFAYIRIVCRRFLRGRVSLGFDYKHERFLGLDIELDKFREDFYWIFTEIFIEEVYYFESDTDTPYIVDVGGNFGMSVLYFKALYPKSKIITFEPSPDNLEILKRNISRNQLREVEVVEGAVGKKSGKLSIFTQGPGTTIYQEFASKQKHINNSEFGKEVMVSMYLLSDYVKKPVEFLKLDVEGAEGEVLENLDNTGKLAQVKRMAVEYHQFSSKINTLSQIAKILEKNRFTFFCASEFKNIVYPTKRKYRIFMIFAEKQDI